MSFKFEKLIVWEKALDLSDSVSQISRKFPKEEMFVLRSQMQRAADSIALNIAEGTTGVSPKEFERFIGIAIRSAVEVVGCLYLGKRRMIISDADFDACYIQINELVRMLQAFRKSLSKQTDV